MSTQQPFLQVADLRPEPLLLVSSGGTILAANRAVHIRLGLPPTLADQSLRDYLVDSQQTLLDYLRMCSRSRDLVLGALTVRTPGGELPCRAEGAVYQPRAEGREALILLALIPRQSAASPFIALTQRIDALSREISRRRQAEEQVRQQREWLRGTLASIGEAVIATNTSGQIVFLNPEAETLTGWSQEEALHQPLGQVFDILDEQTRQKADDPVARVLREGVRVKRPHHTLLRSRSGAELPVEDCAAPIRDSSDQIIGAVLVFRDVGERHRLERELRHQAEELAEAGRRKDAFLRMLAHELRNPLAPILHSVDLLEQASHDEEIRKQTVGILGRQTRHLSRLVNDLLEATHLARGRIQIQREHLDLSAVVQYAAEDRRALLLEAGLFLVVDTPSTPVWVLGDNTRLTQVVHNLLDNAQRFSDPGGQVEVHLRVTPQQALLSVRDRGIGIEPHLLPSLFYAFVQADHSLDRRRGGLGLGLYLVKSLIELHGGTIRALSAGPGQGAEFIVTLPLESEPIPLAPPALPPVRARQRVRILLIEDNQDLANSLRTLLMWFGHEVRVASTGLEGVELATTWLPDAVVSDIGLPGLDGFEVARRLRQHPGLERALLIALTGFGSEQDRQRSREAGFDIHLTKPAEPSDLQRLLENHQQTLPPHGPLA